MDWVALVLVVVLALGFDYTNGFHDAANAVASVVSTKALSLRGALALAAVMNLVGALAGTGVAVTVVLALVVTGHQDTYHVPLWVILACATALAAGAWSGGLRIMRTLGRRIFHLTPPHGFAHPHGRLRGHGGRGDAAAEGGALVGGG